MDLQLQQKCALVTGAHRGTGNIIAITLAQEGAKVAFHAFTEQQAETLRAELQQQPKSVSGNCYVVVGDILSDKGAEAVLEQIHQHALSIDILVNNYGSAIAGKWNKLTIEQWVEAANINLFSAVRMIQLVTPIMKHSGWGRVINLSTMGDHQPNSIMPHYYAAKAALANSSVSLAKELSHSGITVNTVSPGLIHTEEMEAAYKLRAAKKGWPQNWPELEARIVEHDFPNPSGRLARRQEVADLVAFLASNRAGFINGQNIRIDGGCVRYV